jgi:hypothetical protein
MERGRTRRREIGIKQVWSKRTGREENKRVVKRWGESRRN